MAGSATEKAKTLHTLYEQIKAGSGGSWTFIPARGTDGSYIFSGESGFVTVVNAAGQVFKGGALSLGTSVQVTAAGLTPHYDKLQQIY